ncbi:hypothetical protein NE237_022884 [Protea cynaroides]|uniref:SHORT-ROOT protein n=1 Tax=Protea cynaroides TaxID=273540 RepID=A0A9Q0K5P0_9MAGN|nr:hypothetical protein NE237_022884 [Protea cynaroides]
MDTLFRLVSLQSDQSFNSSRTSSSSRSSRHNNNNFNSNNYQYHHQPEEEEEEEEEECCNNNNNNLFYMDEDDFSSSSSKHLFPYHHQHPTSTATTTTTTTASTSHAAAWEHSSSTAAEQLGFPSSPAPDLNLQGFASDNKWATNLLMETARAIADKNSGRVQQLMWMLNELSSPYGDIEQKLASYFLQALFCRITDSGERCYRTLTSASDKTCSFDSTRKMLLKFQEVSPWTTFGHVACNGAILEALEGESKLHIVDISNTYCTQWPTLLEALATRTDDTPHLRLTTVVANKAAAVGASASGVSAQKVMKEIGNRMEKFARLMGVPFKFKTVHHAGDLSDMNLLAELDLRDDEALAINCVGTLHTVASVENRREAVLAGFRRLRPKIVTVVEEEAELDSVGIGMESGSEEGFDFFRGFQECVRWFRVYLESLDESFPRTSNERLILERATGRALVDLLACPPAHSSERRESAAGWSRRLRETGFNPVPFSDDVLDDVRALLRRYREGCWSMTTTTTATPTTPVSSDAGIFLAWKNQPVVWACAWRPYS